VAGVPDVEVVVAHNERTTLRVGDVFLKVDGDRGRSPSTVSTPPRPAAKSMS
jgi:hypothetical protein